MLAGQGSHTAEALGFLLRWTETSWQDSAAEYVESPDRIDSANALDKVLDGSTDIAVAVRPATLPRNVQFLTVTTTPLVFIGPVVPCDVTTMIDHVLLHAELAPAIRRVFVSRCSDLQTSDHWPVVVDLELPPKVASKK